MSCDVVENHEPRQFVSEWPAGITINKPSRTLDLLWDEQHVMLSHKVLRQSCRCSVCESARRKLNDVIPVAADVALVSMKVLGSTGVQMIFSDGHDRGIYPWSYLRQMAGGPVEPGLTETLMKGWRDE